MAMPCHERESRSWGNERVLNGIIGSIKENSLSLITQRGIEGFEKVCSDVVSITEKNVYQEELYSQPDHHIGSGYEEGKYAMFTVYNKSKEAAEQYLKKEGIPYKEW